MLANYLCTKLVIFVYLINVSNQYPYENCRLVDDAKPRLQVAFVLDGVIPRNKYKFERHPQICFREIMNVLSENYSSEFALTGFWDWKDPVHEGKIDDPDACYKLLVPFTTNKTMIMDQVKNIEEKVNNNTDEKTWPTASYTIGLLFTILEKNLDWNKGYYNTNGEIIRKIVIVLTHHFPTSFLSSTEGKRLPKLDGTDTCSNTLPPTKELIGKAALDNHVVLYFMTLHYGFDIDDHIVYNMTRLLTNSHAIFSIHDEPSNKNNLHLTNFTRVIDLLLNDIQKEVFTCEWESTPCYNTLGL